MKYRDLVKTTEPLETVKQIRQSATLDKARRDVETYVISDRMADQICSVIFPNLQFDQPRDQKGILIVATYGTGKTHLMSVVAGLAEYAELTAVLTHRRVTADAEKVAGRFAVIRFDIGATNMSLRDIVCTELERGLAKLGVDFRFPDWSRTTNVKDPLTDMMAAFEAVHADKGLLFVLDEMLEYLRYRKDAELIQDLVLLRELGEVCASTRFRFISGVQEAIFDNPRFTGVADTVRRVRDRFEQVRISREDVAFVVEERLLRKTAAQRDLIREHLQRFSPLYEGMAERLDRFVALFPVHPDYLRTFEQIAILEKREVLRTIEREMTRLAEEPVPDDAPGLICSDSYRGRLVDDPSFRTIPEVQAVLDKSEVLRNKVQTALPDKRYVETASRIIDGLTIHRLTTEDIYLPIGMTAEMLRDELCLLPPGLPKLDALFLKITIDSIVKKIITAVSGQFLSVDPENGQVYLDVRKDIDYDQRIDERADSLDSDHLDGAYYKAMEEVLGQRDAPYVAGYRIWRYDLPWVITNADRSGYLFMGAPNERSTAQPPRDFYVYFLQPYEPRPFQDEQKPDEVFVRLGKPADEFTRALRRYAGAAALGSESTITHRPVYEDKARDALRTMVSWLRNHMGDAMTVTYQGQTKPFAGWLTATAGPRAAVRDQIDTVTAAVLADHFAARYPGYPRFKVRVTRDNLEDTVRTSLTQVATQRATYLGTKVLEALELANLTNGGLRDDGRFAKALIEAVGAGGGKVVNRSELLTRRDRPNPADEDVWTWAPGGQWHLEPVWLTVVAAALCQQGRLELAIENGRIDALGLHLLTKLTVEQLANFDYLAPPKALPITQLRDIATLLGLPRGVVPAAGADVALVRELVTKAQDLLRRTVDAQTILAERTEFWGDQLFDLPEERGQRLAALKSLLEDVRVHNSPGRMNNLDLAPEALTAAKAGRAELDRIETVLQARDKLAAVAEYLREAVGVFGDTVAEVADANRLRADALTVLRGSVPIEPARVVELKRIGEDLRRRFADLAARAYAHDHLDAAGDKRKKTLTSGMMYVALQQLIAVSLLGGGRFAELQRQLTEIPTLMDFEERKLAESVIYPGLAYRPRAVIGPSALARLEDAERRVDALYNNWAKTLLDSLAEPEMAEQIDLLDPGSRVEVQRFLQEKNLAKLVTASLIQALNQVFMRFEKRQVTQGEVWRALFPDDSPATVEVLRDRFNTFLDDQVSSVPTDRVRILPKTEVSE